MKLRSILLIGTGIAVGYTLAKKAAHDEPYVLKRPQSERATGNPALRSIQDRAQRLTDSATGKSLHVIRRARGAIQSRLESNDDDAAWN